MSGDQEPALTAEVYRDLRRRLQAALCVIESCSRVAAPWSDADVLSKLMRLRDDLAMRGDGSVARGLASAIDGAESTTTALSVARAIGDAIGDAIERIQYLECALEETTRQRDDARETASLMAFTGHSTHGVPR